MKTQILDMVTQRLGFAGFLKQIGSKRTRGALPVTGNICISMVKNEQDIIEPFVRHNARFFDAMVILDNGSADNTRAILLELSRELGTLLVLDQPEPQYD